jgi:hypothetical protein
MACAACPVALVMASSSVACDACSLALVKRLIDEQSNVNETLFTETQTTGAHDEEQWPIKLGDFTLAENTIHKVVSFQIRKNFHA